MAPDVKKATADARDEEIAKLKADLEQANARVTAAEAQIEPSREIKQWPKHFYGVQDGRMVDRAFPDREAMLKSQKDQGITWRDHPDQVKDAVAKRA